MKTYEVTVRREGRWWLVAVPAIDGLTQARRLDEVERVAREYIAVSTDVPLSTVAVEVSSIEAGGRDLLAAKGLVDDLRRRAKDLELMMAELTRELASSLAHAGVPVRDASTILGVSHQRVSQLAQASDVRDRFPWVGLVSVDEPELSIRYRELLAAARPHDETVGEDCLP
ncbi:hypothetical protein [Kribbella jejuensis]|uniref:HicB family toxin-antitoxin system n=1 Tax=Kribbella jejuensis TaxID=236068 RepID=A0A542ENC6_9ACTN|nr:hypothetical protein [Kribbella jejuensis]TQJ16716.1 hypothetical protein FB475_0821 [Kribbella jejuensis]